LSPHFGSEHHEAPEYCEILMEIDAAGVKFDELDSRDVVIGGKDENERRREHIVLFHRCRGIVRAGAQIYAE
jgi:hypothetical protein